MCDAFVHLLIYICNE